MIVSLIIGKECINHRFGEKMENMHILFAITVALCSLSLGCTDVHTETGFTGFEQYQEAYDLANNTTNNIILVHITYGQNRWDGYFNSIQYRFIDIDFNTTSSSFVELSEIYVYVKKNEGLKKKVNCMRYPRSTKVTEGLDIESISINAVEAYNIALNNDDIKDYLKEAEKNWGLCIESAKLTNSYKWFFKWSYNTDPFGEGGAPAWIEIDARTGEVVEIMTSR